MQELEKVIYFASYVITEVREEVRLETLEQIEREFKTKKKEIESRYDKLMAKARTAKPGQGQNPEVFAAQIDTDLSKLQENLKHDITALEKIAADQGLKQNIQMPAATGKKSEKNLYSRLLGITVNGDFIGILKYLKDLEKLNYYFNISSLTVGLDGKNPGNKAVNAILTGKIYTLPGAQKTF